MPAFSCGGPQYPRWCGACGASPGVLAVQSSVTDKDVDSLEQKQINIEDICRPGSLSRIQHHSTQLPVEKLPDGQRRGTPLVTLDTTNAVATLGIAAKCLHLSLTSAAGSQFLSTANFYLGISAIRLLIIPYILLPVSLKVKRH